MLGFRVSRWFWAALVVLVINDHVLKGSGLLPGWLTGKLSDFAGLMVAPPLAAALASAWGLWARRVAFASVVVAFVAVKVSPSCATWVGEGLSVIGLRSHIWCDPTDLMALVVLPSSARIVEMPRQIMPGQVRLWTQRTGLVVAALACMATSESGPETSSLQPPFVINWTRQAMTVEIEAHVHACESDAGVSDAGAADTRDAGSSVLERKVTLDPGDFTQLTDEPMSCGAARIRAKDGPVATIRWDRRASTRLSRDVIPQHSKDDVWTLAKLEPWATDRAVLFTGAASEPTVVLGRSLSKLRNDAELSP